MKAAPAPKSRLADPLVTVDPLQIPNWDSLLARHPRAGPFHTAGWAKVLHETYGYFPQYLVVKRDQQLDSVVPLMEVKSWLTGTRGIALPYTDSCEPLGCDPVLKDKIFSHLIDLGEKRHWKYLEGRWEKSGFAEAPAWNEFFIHDLHLDADHEGLFSRFDSATRRSITGAKKRGVTVTIDQTLAGMKSFYRLHSRTRQRHGLPPQPFNFFRKIQQHLIARNLGMVILAKVEKTVVAAAVFLHFGTRAIYKFGASDLRFQNFRGNNAVMWEAIQWYCRNGFQSFDFGRSSVTNEGLRRFKLGWATNERKIQYVRYNFQQRQFVSGQDQAFGWHNRVFNNLPLPVSRMIGSTLYRHLA